MEGLSDITKAAFGQVLNKYVVKGEYAEKNERGNLEYLTPPGANIQMNKQVAYNPKTGWRKVKKVAMFVLGKVVSRTTKYQEQIRELSNMTFRKDSTRVGEIRVDLNENGVKIYAESGSETFFLETRKQAGKTPIRPIFKAFRSAVNIWKKVRIKMGKV